MGDPHRGVNGAYWVHYVHLDKAPELWINEVGVAPTHHGQGIAPRLLGALLDRARALGCTEAWVLTSEDNAAARRAYAKAGGVEEPERPIYVTFPLSTTCP